LHEVKLILIGRGEAGKTSVVRALMGKRFRKEKETPGIAIGTWVLDCNGTKIKVHVWDFAGQEIAHEAHRFFLTERCIYLVVTEGRFGGQDEDADHWLAHVEQYGTHEEPGKPPQTSPALVVGNKAELCAAPLEKRRLLREHPCVREFLETDCKTGRGIEELRKKLCEIIVSKEMESVRQPFPTEWQRMKERMEDWKKLKRHFFTYGEFAKECGREKVTHGDDLALTHVLNQLGIALYYGHNPRLRDTRVLDPQWLVNGMYALIRGVEKHGDRKRPGELGREEVELRLRQGLKLMKGKLTLKDYPPEAQQFLLELMEDRELCFVAQETQSGVPVYLLPGLLPKDEPEDIDLDSYLELGPERVRLRFVYKLLPDGLVPRFIVRTQSLSSGQPRWRRGVILQWQGAEAEAEPATAAIAGGHEAEARGGGGEGRHGAIAAGTGGDGADAPEEHSRGVAAGAGSRGGVGVVARRGTMAWRGDAGKSSATRQAGASACGPDAGRVAAGEGTAAGGTGDGLAAQCEEEGIAGLHQLFAQGSPVSGTADNDVSGSA